MPYWSCRNTFTLNRPLFFLPFLLPGLPGPVIQQEEEKPREASLPPLHHCSGHRKHPLCFSRGQGHDSAGEPQRYHAAVTFMFMSVQLWKPATIPAREDLALTPQPTMCSYYLWSQEFLHACGYPAFNLCRCANELERRAKLLGGATPATPALALKGLFLLCT